MLNVEYRLKLGQDEFIIKGDYKNEKEFFNKMSFFSSLPKTAPGGATDLKLVVRETKKGTYYSVISEQEKLEFQLGQHKEGDTLYAKGWVPLYQGNDADYDGGGQQAAAPVGAPVAAPKAAAPRVAAPIVAPVAAPVAPQVPVPQTVQAPTPVAAPTPIAVPQPVAAPVQAAPAAAAPAAANPQVTAVANNVLARFGINK